MRPQVGLSPHLGGRVRERDSLNIHSVSPLLLMGSFMCVIKIEFRYCSLFCVVFIHAYTVHLYFSIVGIANIQIFYTYLTCMCTVHLYFSGANIVGIANMTIRR